MSNFKSYLEMASASPIQKRISILINGYEVDANNNPIGVVSKRVEGDDMQEFAADYEIKFGEPMPLQVRNALVKVFNAAIERAQEAGTTNADVDAAIVPNGVTAKEWAQKTGRGMTRQ